MGARSRWRAWLLVLAASVAGSWHAAPGAAQDADSGEGGSEEALFLLLPVGAHGVGVGRAMTAFPSEEAAFWNPAGLARATEPRALLYRGDQLAGVATAISGLLPVRRVGTFGISYLLLDIGDQDLRDDFGSVLGSISIRNHLAIASFATSLPEEIDVGVNLKLVQFRIACRGQCPDLETTSSAYALDVGMQMQPFDETPLRFGWMIAHAGTEFQVINQEQSDPLPTRFRLAASWEMLARADDEAPMSLWLAAEAEEEWRDPGSPSVYLGMDYGVADLVSIRAGYVAGRYDQTNGASVGLGFGLERFRMSLAKSLTRSVVTGETEPVHITLSAIFE